MGKTDYLELLKNQGLISFEEITDYSIITDKKKKGKKRKLADEEPEVNDDFFNDDDLKPTKAKKKKKVKFADEKIEEIKTNNVKNGVKKEKKKKQKKKNVKKDVQSSNATSKLQMNAPIDELDEQELYQKMSAWSEFPLPKTLLNGLYRQGFLEPTQIQRLVVPIAIKQRQNIIGAAQTGSGKTLAFGLPILARLSDKFESGVETMDDEKGPQALILTPTRELAIQIKQHLQICAKYQKVKIVVVVGGISQLKQERLLRKCPEIVVATPGRLMQLIDEGNDYLNKIDKIKYLVVDEADRMIEKQHYSELQKLLKLINSDEKAKLKRQNFLFSATLVTNFANNEIKKKDKANLDVLINRLEMSKEPKVIDLTTKQITADSLFQTKISCTVDEKDIYLYYFTSKYSGRTLVFANSIDCVRRLTNIFRLLKKEPLHLHANMTQKQRLKNLERFQAEDNSLLIASDVAARGLDIPGVMHVIHYQVPRSAEIYIHRSGRTARSTKEGLSVLLVSPNELNLFQKIMKTFEKDSDLKDYPIDVDYFSECKKRVQIARKINESEYQMSKENSNKNWFVKNAKALDIELDDELEKETYIDNDNMRKRKNELKSLRTQLDKSLKQMIIPKSFSISYLHVDSINRIKSINDSNENAINVFKNNKIK